MQQTQMDMTRIAGGQCGGEAEYIIGRRNTHWTGGVTVSFSNDQSHELLSSPLKAATGETETKRGWEPVD